MNDKASQVTSSAHQKLLSYSPLIIGLMFFVAALCLYFASFGALEFRFWENLSDNKSEWGAFGDFMGGLVNPLLALVTVWLITKSLGQNGEMLAAAKRELKMARKEIKRGVAVQKATEAALQSQINIAQQVRDFESAVAMVNVFNEKSETLSRDCAVG